MKPKILAALLYIALALIWCGLLFVLYLFFLLSDIVRYFHSGILKAIFLFVSIGAFAIPIAFRKKRKAVWGLPLTLLLCAVVSAGLNGVIYHVTEQYISSYSRQKWDRYEKLRKYMIDDLERQYPLIGKTEQEVIDILGQPANRSNYSGQRFEYYIGDGFMDPYTYDLLFKNGVVVDTDIVQH